MIEKHRFMRPRDTQVHAAAGEFEQKMEFSELVPAAASTFDGSVAKAIIQSGHALPFKRYQVQVLPLTQIYHRTIFPELVDLLTVDVEGSGLSVLKGIDFTLLRPRMIVLEMNDDSRDAPMREFLRSHGYEAIRTFGCNEVFVGGEQHQDS